MSKTNIEAHTIKDSASIKEALLQLNNYPKIKTLFVINSDRKIIGSITDGDIRRGLIKGVITDDLVATIANISFEFVVKGKDEQFKLDKLKSKGIFSVPVVDGQNRIIDILDLKNLKDNLPIEAVLMAGGLGSRLKELTKNTPKPLLKIDNKPIIEYNIDQLIKYGVETIYISVNYLKDQIIDYFGNGESKGISIEYIEEENRTGTLGSVSLVEQFGTEQILVMNSDLLTNINFRELYRAHIANQADLSVATVPYHVNIPYGVIETNEDKVTSLVEKPTYTYYSNAGIYIINTNELDRIEKGAFYDTTDLINELINENSTVFNFPIHSYWLDIGNPNDFEQAKKDVKTIDFGL